MNVFYNNCNYVRFFSNLSHKCICIFEIHACQIIKIFGTLFYFSCVINTVTLSILQFQRKCRLFFLHEIYKRSTNKCFLLQLFSK